MKPLRNKLLKKESNNLPKEDPCSIVDPRLRKSKWIPDHRTPGHMRTITTRTTKSILPRAPEWKRLEEMLQEDREATKAVQARREEITTIDPPESTKVTSPATTKREATEEATEAIEEEGETTLEEDLTMPIKSRKK